MSGGGTSWSSRVNNRVQVIWESHIVLIILFDYFVITNKGITMNDYFQNHVIVILI